MSPAAMDGPARIRVIDSHTEGEPTRVVVDGAPALGRGSAAQRLARFREQHDRFRSAVCNEPRGFDALVGALLLPPEDPVAVAQVRNFNVDALLAKLHRQRGDEEARLQPTGLEGFGHRREVRVTLRLEPSRRAGPRRKVGDRTREMSGYGQKSHREFFALALIDPRLPGLEPQHGDQAQRGDGNENTFG